MNRRSFNKFVFVGSGLGVLSTPSIAMPRTNWPSDGEDRVRNFFSRRIQTIGTSGTYGVPEHGFNRHWYLQRAKNPACKIIFQNEFYAEADGWITLPFDRGHLSFVVNQNLPIENIGRRDLERVLTGEVSNWREIGIDGGPIKMVRVRPPDINQAWNADNRVGRFLFNGGLAPEKVFRKTSTATDYEDLRRSIKSDSDILGIGLRDVSLDGLRVLTIDGEEIRPQVRAKSYPFTLESNISLRGTKENWAFVKETTEELERRVLRDRANWELYKERRIET